MQKIIYYVASSLDGYISGKDEDISGFVGEGNGVEKYLADLQAFKTVIMGRKTYEFGYKFGLKPGEPAYPHMEHHIFSSTLSFENAHPNIHVSPLSLEEIDKIRETSETDIYLCGGGDLAGWLLENERIDVLKLKVNPLILGEGVRLFGNTTKSYALQLMANETYENGLLMNTYQIIY